MASSSPSSVGYWPIDLRFSSLFEVVLFCIDDGGAFPFALLAAEAGVVFAGLFALRFAVGVEGVEGLPADKAEDGERPWVLI